MISNVNELFLRHREDRVKLLRAGFLDKEIESLYLMLNSFELVGVTWLWA
jgi:hypothetical protein